MRKQHWLAPIWAAALLLTTVSSSYGQAPPGGMMPAPVYGGGYPAPMAGGGPGSVPIADPSLVPAGFNPWPSISPYENRYSQTTNEGGLWFNSTSNAQREYYFTADATLKWVRRPNRSWVGSGEIINETLGNASGVPVLTVGGAFDDDVAGSQLVDKSVTGNVIDKGSSPGFNLAWGYEEVDGSGANIEGWYQSELEWVWRRGQSDITTPALYLARVTAAVPLLDNNNNGVVFYDQKFEIKQDSSSGGAAFNVFLTPRYKSSSGTFKIRPSWGLRYMFIREHFSFYGVDSGFRSSTITIPPDPLPFDFPPGTPDIPNAAQIVPAYFSRLNSNVNSQLAGPHIGLNWEAGGDDFKLSGGLKFGLLANFERVKLSTEGLGDPITNLAYSQFASTSASQSHTHVSPMLEYNIRADWYLFQHLPLLREMKVFEDAKFRFGYNLMNVWQIARPNDVIAWRGQPLDSFIDMKYTKWYMHGFTLGLDWRY